MKSLGIPAAHYACKKPPILSHVVSRITRVAHSLWDEKSTDSFPLRHEMLSGRGKATVT